MLKKSSNKQHEQAATSGEVNADAGSFSCSVHPNDSVPQASRACHVSVPSLSTLIVSDLIAEQMQVQFTQGYLSS